MKTTSPKTADAINVDSGMPTVHGAVPSVPLAFDPELCWKLPPSLTKETLMRRAKAVKVEKVDAGVFDPPADSPVGELCDLGFYQFDHEFYPRDNFTSKQNRMIALHIFKPEVAEVIEQAARETSLETRQALVGTVEAHSVPATVRAKCVAGCGEPIHIGEPNAKGLHIGGPENGLDIHAACAVRALRRTEASLPYFHTERVTL